MTNLEVAIAEPGNNMTPNEAQLQWLDNYINNTLLPAWYAEHPDLAPVTDQDSDGVPDDIEAELGTNPNNPDTDGDGLTDGEEIYQPDGTTIKTGHELDTDGDGIIDALEPNTDLDGDGQSAATGDTNDQDPCIPDTHSAPCQATTATADTTDNTLSPTPPTTDPTPTTPGNSEATDRSNDSSTPLLIAGVIASLGLLALGFWLLTHRHKKNKTPPTPT